MEGNKLTSTEVFQYLISIIVVLIILIVGVFNPEIPNIVIPIFALLLVMLHTFSKYQNFSSKLSDTGQAIVTSYSYVLFFLKGAVIGIVVIDTYFLLLRGQSIIVNKVLFTYLLDSLNLSSIYQGSVEMQTTRLFSLIILFAVGKITDYILNIILVISDTLYWFVFGGGSRDFPRM